jgi:sugar phosphate isomerase/epimerase
MAEIDIPPSVLEAAARAMAKAGYGFAGIELTDPYTADAEYWGHTARAALLAGLKAWPGMSTGPNIYGRQDAVMHLPLPPQEGE